MFKVVLAVLRIYKNRAIAQMAKSTWNEQQHKSFTGRMFTAPGSTKSVGRVNASGFDDIRQAVLVLLLGLTHFIKVGVAVVDSRDA